MTNPDDESVVRDRLTRRAAIVRSRMLRGIDELDERRHELVHTAEAVGRAARRSLPSLIAVAAGTSIIVAVAVYAKRRRHPWRTALAGVDGALEANAESPSAFGRMLKGVALGLAVRFAKRAGVRFAEQLIERTASKA